MKVIFEAIILAKAWKWCENSRIYITFGPRVLGEWKYDYGPGVFIRYIIVNISDLE